VTQQDRINVRFEVFTSVTMKKGVFWDVRPCGSCKNRRFTDSCYPDEGGAKFLRISVLTRATRPNTPEDTILQRQNKNRKSR
jgi:hypothetical protein